MLISSLAAFAFARLRFRGREAIFLFYLATLMIPFPVTLIPNFLIVKNLGWYDTYWALIVPGLFSVFSVFLLRQYYRGMPIDLDEAARMDGASSLRIWWQVIVPLSGPVLATLAIFVFQGVWNDFLWPLVVTTSEEMRTMPVGLAALSANTARPGTCSWPARSSPCCRCCSSTCWRRTGSSRASPSAGWAGDEQGRGARGEGRVTA
jgi:multiple sugar transport system permease protein